MRYPKDPAHRRAIENDRLRWRLDVARTARKHFAHGRTQAEVANIYRVSVRTLQRWIAELKATENA